MTFGTVVGHYCFDGREFQLVYDRYSIDVR